MSAEKPDEASSSKPALGHPRPGADQEQEKPETDRTRAGKGSGASGGGSSGNLPGESMTGGSPEFGPRESQTQGPVVDHATNDPKNKKD